MFLASFFLQLTKRVESHMLPLTNHEDSECASCEIT